MIGSRSEVCELAPLVDLGRLLVDEAGLTGLADSAVFSFPVAGFFAALFGFAGSGAADLGTVAFFAVVFARVVRVGSGAAGGAASAN